MGRSFLLVSAVLVLPHSTIAKASDSLFLDRIVDSGVGAIGDFDGDSVTDRVDTAASGTVVRFHRGDGYGGFLPPVEFTNLGFSASAAKAAADVDLDGRDDVILSSPQQGLLIVGRGGTGGLVQFVATSFPSLVFTEELVLADFNSDGRPDVYSPQGSPGVTGATILHSDGFAGFSLGPSFSYGSGIFGNDLPVVCDADNDGDLDLVTGFSASSNAPAGIATFLNQGSTFVRVDFDPGIAFGLGSSVEVHAAAEFDGDGDFDLFTQVYDASTITNFFVLLADVGPGVAYAPAQDLDAASIAPGFPINALTPRGFADFDGDGLCDVLFDAAATTETRRVVLRAASTPTGFVFSASYPSVHFSNGPLVDLDQDGQLDMISGTNTTSLIDFDVAHDDGALRQVPTPAASRAPLAVADFDADGDIDVVVAGADAKSLLLHRNVSGSGFLPPTTIATLTGLLARVRAIDHDGDFDTDLVVLAADRVSVWWNDGAANFTLAASSTSTTISDTYFELAVRDVNGDGIADAIHDVSNAVRIALGSASGLASNLDVPIASSILSSFALGDVDGDGRIDIVTTERPSTANVPGRIGVYAGNASGGFSLAFLTQTGVKPSGVACGDFDHDGRADVAVVTHADAKLIVYRSTGTTLEFVQDFPIAKASEIPSSLDAIDLTGDGWLDLIAHGYITRIWLGHDGGSFSLAGGFATGIPSFELEFADLDGDARADMIHTAPNAARFEIHFGNDDAMATESYGVGKPGSNGVPALVALGPPQLGAASGLRIENGLPGAVPLLFLGLSPSALPFDRGTLLVIPSGPILVLPVFSAVGSVDLPAVLPPLPSLRGADLYFQSMHIDPVSIGPYQTAQSQGLHWTLGN